MSIRRTGKEELTRRLRILLFVLAGAGLSAGTAAAGTITVGWNLMADSNVVGYRVFVGTQSRTYTQTFDVPADQDFFIFRNAFMGVRYFFAVAARFDSGVGPRSSEVTAVGTRTVPGTRPDGARVPDPALSSACGLDCFVVTDLARNLGEISSIAAAGDGSVFAVENGRRVVLLREGSAVTAFEAEPGTTLRDVALDPQFATTGRVFLSLLRTRDRATADLEVLRLRHLSGVLGEPSAIVTGLAVPATALAPVAVGDDALVYVALPALLARHPYSAAVLAFDQDGHLPAGQHTPVVARGFDQPADMAWDTSSRAVWLVGRSTGSDEQVIQLSRTAIGAAPASNGLSAGDAAVAVAVASGVARRRLLLAAGVDLVEEAPGTADRIRISLEGFGAPVAVTASAGARYVAMRHDGVTATYRVAKVEDGNTRGAR
jgi:hypothetical protein